MSHAHWLHHVAQAKIGSSTPSGTDSLNVVHGEARDIEDDLGKQARLSIKCIVLDPAW